MQNHTKHIILSGILAAFIFGLSFVSLKHGSWELIVSLIITLIILRKLKLFSCESHKNKLD